jgi:hypothetical protein
MWGVKLAITVVVVLMSVTVALATPASAQVGPPPDIAKCVAAPNPGLCFIALFALPPQAPDFVRTCLREPTPAAIGDCFRRSAPGIPAVTLPPVAGIPDLVRGCLLLTDPLARAACFAGRGGG